MNDFTHFEKLSDETSEKIKYEKQTGTFAKTAFDSENGLRRNPSDEIPSVWQNCFMSDINKILYCPYYSRCTDKTQVFSLYKNDDITRRSLHMQLVSRIARTIGSALNLNLDLIEAIALGHDIGHTPFAHTGEVFLDELYRENTGRTFIHNVHSVRVLDKIYPYNLTLQVLDGIIAHNGEFELEKYEPSSLKTFAEFDKLVENCYIDPKYSRKIMPSTLEGCVVRISDIIAYLGKDRQDALNTKIVSSDAFADKVELIDNNELINNLIVNIIDNSYGKNYIKLDTDHFRSLKEMKRTNYNEIYYKNAEQLKFNETVKPMMRDI
ncbi:MAG: HD domain-containing protein, partial [Clostridia bacterium]|nr:HD domain-containing protein [Clostridia bacterium]